MDRCAVLSRSVVSYSLQPHGLQPARLFCPWGFSRQEYCSGQPFSSPEDLPNPGIEPRSPTLQADSLLSEPPGKPIRYNLLGGCNSHSKKCKYYFVRSYQKNRGSYFVADRKIMKCPINKHASISSQLKRLIRELPMAITTIKVISPHTNISMVK